ncbi:MAG: D-glycerate dehydrogenase [bacterium]|jgi:lactate dehydrogenase-like 2-hydroxyacid dehydrogenase|nr:D-glycerate dehydrogenase [bacterium]
MPPRIYITRALPEPVWQALDETGFAYEVYPEDRVIPKDVLLQQVQNRDGILCILTDPIDREVLDAATQVKIIANYAVGYNNIDVDEATRRGIAVTNTPGVLTDATADLAWTLLFATARKVVASDTYLRQGRFTGWGPMHFLGQDITNRTLGVVGLGRIGRAFAAKAAGFNMKILYYARRRDAAFEEAYNPGAQWVDLETVLKNSDFLSIHLPLTPETTHLIGKRELRMMKPNAILINTARGPIVDEAALAHALRERWIWGAGLDVYEDEPAVHPDLLGLPNTTLLPHIGSATTETRTRMGLMAVENLKAFFTGQRPPNLVNPAMWPPLQNASG